MRLTPLLLALPIALATSPVRADPTSDLQELLGQTVLSAASKTAEIGSLAPATSSTISAGELRRYGIRTVAEAINFLSMGMTASDRLFGVEVGARGVLLNGDYDAHVLLLINGHAVNEPWGGSSGYDRGAGVPLELVDHIEVILGPGSVMYGSSAMLGVVNVVTKRARDYQGVHFIAEGDLFTSLRVGAGAGVEFKLFGVPGELSFQIEYAVQRGPTFHLGPQPYGVDAVTGQPKSFSPGNVTGIWGGEATKSYWSATPAALSRLVIGNFEINARFFQFKRSQPGLDLQSVQIGDFNAADNYESDHEVSVDISHRATLSEAVQLRTRLYGDLYQYNWFASTSAAEDCSGADPGGCRGHLQGTARWAGLEIQPTVDWFHDGSFVTMVGVDGRIRYVVSATDEVDSTGRNRIEFDSDEHLEPSMGVYGQQTFQVTKWLGFSAGARADIDPRYHSVHVSPRAAVTVSPWRGGTLRAIYSEAFRAPSAFEAYYTSVQQAWAKNPDLMPELVRGVEASLEQRFGSQRIFVGVFRSWWSDMILLQTITGADLDKAIAAGNVAPGTTSASQYQNVGVIDNQGFNASYDGSVAEGRLRYGVTVTGAYSRRQFADGTTGMLTVAPSVFGNARASYDLGGALPTLALAGQLMGPRAADRALDGGFTPAPYVGTTAVLRATVSGQVPGLTGLSFRLTASFASNTHSPYVIGPNQYATPQQPTAELSPVDRFRVGVGLRYDLLP